MWHYSLISCQLSSSHVNSRFSTVSLRSWLFHMWNRIVTCAKTHNVTCELDIVTWEFTHFLMRLAFFNMWTKLLTCKWTDVTCELDVFTCYWHFFDMYIKIFTCGNKTWHMTSHLHSFHMCIHHFHITKISHVKSVVLFTCDRLMKCTFSHVN